MTPPAAIAVIRATIEDAPLAEILQHPDRTAQRVAQTLERAGWHITPTRPANGPQTAA